MLSQYRTVVVIVGSRLHSVTATSSALTESESLKIIVTLSQHLLVLRGKSFLFFSFPKFNRKEGDWVYWSDGLKLTKSTRFTMLGVDFQY